MQPRFALRFWPDTRAMVKDQVGIAPDNQGVSVYGAQPVIAGGCNAAGSCPVTVWQQMAGSNFVRALNSLRQMFTGIDYTVIYSTSDEGVAPADTALEGPGSYARIALQDVCPGHVSDHLMNGSVDPVTWALVLDAITHRGPADRTRIAGPVCSQAINPELDPVAVATQAPLVAAELAANVARSPFSKGEPPLRCYVTATCPRRHHSPGLRHPQAPGT